MTSRHDELRAAVVAFHKAHPAVWTLFDRFTRDRISRGFEHYSVNAIFERIRWESDQAVTGENEFKLNNNYRAFYARAWMKVNPEPKGFFRTRVQISKDADPAIRPELEPADFPYTTN